MLGPCSPSMGTHPMSKQELGPVPAPRHQVKFNPRTGGYHQPLNAIKAEGLQRQPCATEGSLFMHVLLIHGSEPGYPLCSFLGDPFQACAVSPPLAQGMGFRAVVPGERSGLLCWDQWHNLHFSPHPWSFSQTPMVGVSSTGLPEVCHTQSIFPQTLYLLVLMQLGVT